MFPFAYFFIIKPNNSIQNESNPYLVNMTAKLIEFLYNQRCIFFTVLNKLFQYMLLTTTVIRPPGHIHKGLTDRLYPDILKPSDGYARLHS